MTNEFYGFENLTMFHYEHNDYSSLIFTTSYFTNSITSDLNDTIMHSIVYPVYKNDVSRSPKDFLNEYVRENHISTAVIAFDSSQSGFDLASHLTRFIRSIDRDLPVIGLSGLLSYLPGENCQSFSNRVSEIAPMFNGLVVSDIVRHDSELDMYSDMLTTVLSILEHDKFYCLCSDSVSQF